ncbi:acyl--CoA ligase [Streptomyces sp. NBC_00708]
MTTGPHHIQPTGVWEAGRTTSWDEVTRQAGRLVEQVAAARPSAVAAAVPTGQALVTALVATRGMDSTVMITGPSVSDDRLAALGVDAVVEWPEASKDCTVRRLTGAVEASAPAEPGLCLLSSGTTGEPKPTHWPWRTLARGEWGRGSEHWAIGYAPHSFAAVSATCQALGRAACVEFVRPAELATARPDAVPLTVAAATPSFWRLAAIANRDPAEFRRVDTVTIGGEPTDASLLRLLGDTVTPRRIKQIFGTTELGTVLHVDDGRPGLPESLLGRRLPSGAAFDIRDGHLCVSVGPGTPFVDTGDEVKIDEGRVHVIGRTGVFVNVGGLKANPYRVAQVLQQHESVLAARAYGLRNALLGKVVAADVVLRPGSDPLLLIPELKRYSAGLLDAHERPQRIKNVESLAVAESGKVQL